MGTFGRKAQIKCCSLFYRCNKNNELKLFSEALHFILFHFPQKEIFPFLSFNFSSDSIGIHYAGLVSLVMLYDVTQ